MDAIRPHSVHDNDPGPQFGNEILFVFRVYTHNPNTVDVLPRSNPYCRFVKHCALRTVPERKDSEFVFHECAKNC